MSQALRQFLSALGKLFLGILAKQPFTPGPAPEPEPEPVPQPIPSPVPPPTPVPVFQPQSAWWNGVYAVTQPYGCTHSIYELHNPNHPDCDRFHDGEDFALPCGTPLFAVGNFVVFAVDDPAHVEAYGVAALGLIAGTQGHPEGHDVWLLHMQSYAVKYGDSVRRGTFLGRSGTRGRSTGCHLHFQVVPRGGNYFSSINPAAWITMKG